MAKCHLNLINSVLNVKAVVAAFNQEKALVGAFSTIMNPLCGPSFEALVPPLRSRVGRLDIPPHTFYFLYLQIKLNIKYDSSDSL